MKKILLLSALVIICASFISIIPHSYKQGTSIKTVIIDPGHGGVDPGARGLFSNEADVALEVSLKFGKALEQEFPNVKVLYTRTKDVLPGNKSNITDALRYRAEFANQSKGDLFFCIHCNSAGMKAGGWYAKRVVGHKNKVVYTGKGKRRKKKTVKVPIYESYYVENKAKGTETYIWAADRTDDKSEVMSGEDIGESVEDAANALDLNSPEARIRAQLYTKYYFKNSYTLARYIEEEFQKAGRASRGVKQRNNKGIWVLQATGMPSILAEIGYISNKEEEQYLNSESGQAEVVSNLLEAFRRYKKDVEGKK